MYNLVWTISSILTENSSSCVPRNLLVNPFFFVNTILNFVCFFYCSSEPRFQYSFETKLPETVSSSSTSNVLVTQLRQFSDA